MNMKKLALILIGLVVMLAPLAISAAAPPVEVTSCTMNHDLTGLDWENKGFTCPAKGAVCQFDSTVFTCGSCCMLNTIYTVTDWIFLFVIAMVTIMVLMGGYNLVTAAGDPEKVAKGKNYVLWASIGFVVALAAKAIPYIAKNILGV